jgi:hypothetical protein
MHKGMGVHAEPYATPTRAVRPADRSGPIGFPAVARARNPPTGMTAGDAGHHAPMATRKEGKLAGSGGRLAAIGAVLVVIGIVMALLLDGTALGIGVAIAVLGAIPLVAGVVLVMSAGVEQRSRKDKPFA